MGFLTRALIPSKVRRVAHPVRAVKRTVIPRPIRQAQGIARSVANPVSTVGFAVENAAVRAVRGGGRRLPSGYSASPRGGTAREQKLYETRALARYLDDLASVHEQEFPRFVNPEAWTQETSTRFRRQVARDLKKGIPFWSRSRRAAAKAAVDSEVDARLHELIKAAEALESNVPEAVLSSLEVAFDDNATRAVPLECEGTTATIALVVSDPNELLGNRLPGVTEAGNPSLATWPKQDRNDFYMRVILSDVVATAKEGFANAPGVEVINVVVIRLTDLSETTERLDPVIHLRIDRAVIESVDWKRTAPSEGLRDVPVVMEQNMTTGYLEPLSRGDHPDISLALDALLGERTSGEHFRSSHNVAKAARRRELSEALQRLEEALAPGLDEVVRSQVTSADAPESVDREEAMTLIAQAIVGRFMSVDGELGGDELAAFDEISKYRRLSEGPGESWPSVNERSDLFRSFANVGSNALDLLGPCIRALLDVEGESAVERFIVAAVDVARATCDLDGRDPEEEEALTTFESELQEGLTFFKEMST